MRRTGEVLRKAGHEVVELEGQPREKLIEELRDADALLVRSATKVDRELLEAAPRLTVVGRAGVGVDNVDVPAATARGILVINAPTANVVSAVEHTFALLFALLRRVPAAAASMEAGKWDKSKFVGIGALRARRWASSAWARSAHAWRFAPAPSRPGCSGSIPTCRPSGPGAGSSAPAACRSFSLPPTSSRSTPRPAKEASRSSGERSSPACGRGASS